MLKENRETTSAASCGLRSPEGRTNVSASPGRGKMLEETRKSLKEASRFCNDWKSRHARTSSLSGPDEPDQEASHQQLSGFVARTARSSRALTPGRRLRG